MVITYERRSGEDFLPHSGSFMMQIAEAAFRQAYPTFENTSVLDELRVKEYARLDEQQQVYLDYTGGGLYAESQLREHMELLCCSVFAIGLRPRMELVETLHAPVAEALVNERERRWMLHLFQQGANLTNVDCIRMPNLYAAARFLPTEFLNEPLESPVWKELARLHKADFEEWM